jgi:hypothetical protein
VKERRSFAHAWGPAQENCKTLVAIVGSRKGRSPQFDQKIGKTCLFGEILVETERIYGSNNISKTAPGSEACWTMVMLLAQFEMVTRNLL